ncbi:hypothetical protein [Microbacterium sp.]|uniref:hypothetical protein n=1 Tax=Microbacterium sp. TaxID=51671 RepID=UPI0033416263
MNTDTSARAGRSRTAPLLAGAVAAALLLAGCSSTQSAEPAATEKTPQADTSQKAPTPRGAFGLIAAAQEGQLQVQGRDSQTTVRYTGDTTVRRTVTVDVSALKVGDCVVAIGGPDEAATTITVTEAVDGECPGGFPGGGGGFPGGASGGGMPTDRPDRGDLPDGAPTDMPEGGPGGSFGGFTAGAVTAVASGSVTVDAKDAEGKTESTTIVVNGDTAVSATTDSTTAEIAVGLCVTAQGEADDAGGYDATTLTLSRPGDDGECTGMGGFRGALGAPPADRGGDRE